MCEEKTFLTMRQFRSQDWKSFPEVFPLNFCWQWWWLPAGWVTIQHTPWMMGHLYQYQYQYHMTFSNSVVTSIHLSTCLDNQIFNKVQISESYDMLKVLCWKVIFWFHLRDLIGGSFFNFGTGQPIRGLDILLPSSKALLCIQQPPDNTKLDKTQS